MPAPPGRRSGLLQPAERRQRARGARIRLLRDRTAGLRRRRPALPAHPAVVETILHDGNGSAIEIIDFAPRHRHHGRSYRPTTIIRQIRNLRGTPRIVIRVRPSFAYGSVTPTLTRGSNHIRYVSADKVLRLTTDAPIAYVLDETPFVLTTR